MCPAGGDCFGANSEAARVISSGISQDYGRTFGTNVDVVGT